MFVLIDSYQLSTQKLKDLLFNINSTHKISIKKIQTYLMTKTITKPTILNATFEHSILTMYQQAEDSKKGSIGF